MFYDRNSLYAASSRWKDVDRSIGTRSGVLPIDSIMFSIYLRVLHILKAGRVELVHRRHLRVEMKQLAVRFDEDDGTRERQARGLARDSAIDIVQVVTSGESESQSSRLLSVGRPFSICISTLIPASTTRSRSPSWTQYLVVLRILPRQSSPTPSDSSLSA